MCTAVIVQTERPRGYVVVFNRDEMRSRGVATPPVITRGSQGPAYISPTDPDAGGTWLAATERGDVYGILNRYEDSAHYTPRDPVISRGMVIGWMLGRSPHATPEAVFASKRDALQRVRPFRLIAVTGTGEPTVWSWTGQTLETETLSLPALMVSAGQNQADVERARSQRLTPHLAQKRGWGPLAAALASHEGTDAFSQTCLHLPDVATVSQTVVTVAPGDVTMHYKAGSPCVRRSWHATRLARDMSDHH